MTATAMYYSHAFVGSSYPQFAPMAASCGYNRFYAGPNYHPYVHASADAYGYVVTEVSWESTEAKLDVQIKPEPKRNPNGYRQRKLKAKMNQL